MLISTVHHNFLPEDKCDAYLSLAKEFFEVDERTYSGWHTKTNRSNAFEKEIEALIAPVSPFPSFSVSWINIAEYENGRGLNLHRDMRSEYTFVISLTGGYKGGDFILDRKHYTLGKGDCISFDGLNNLHGVTPVVEGYRASLNIWIKNTTRNTL